MARAPVPVFLERGSYRKRRLTDALKLLALLGAVLWMIPMLWPNGSDPDVEPLAMSHALFYIFGAWIVLIVLSAVFVHRQDPPADSGTRAEKQR